MDVKDSANPSGPITLPNGWTVEVNRDTCIGAAPCTAIASGTFGLDDEGKAVILPSADEEAAETILDAARACPIGAIIVKDENRNQLFPEA